jgi:hypothetical protein
MKSILFAVLVGKPSDSTTLFLKHVIELVERNHRVVLIHVHFFSLKGIDQFLTELTAEQNSWESWFPPSAEKFPQPMPLL